MSFNLIKYKITFHDPSATVNFTYPDIQYKKFSIRHMINQYSTTEINTSAKPSTVTD